MKTANTKPVSFDVGNLIDKAAVAEALECCFGSDAFYLECDYLPDYVLYDDAGNEIDSTLGHVFTATMTFPDHGEIWLTDQNGDLRLQLADALEVRAKALRDNAKALRRHHAKHG